MRQKLTLKDIRIDWPKFRDERGNTVASSDLMTEILAQLMLPDWRYEPLSGEWYYCNDDGTWQRAYNVLQAITAHLLEQKAPLQFSVKSTDKIQGDNFSNTIKRKLEARAELQVTVDDFDKHHHILNTPAGPIDLRNGNRLARNPDLLLRQTTAAIPTDDDDGKNCPNYIEHLNFVSGKDQDLINYLEALAGYCLTGYINQQEFYTWYGHGANGKSALAGIWVYCMGEYATEANPGQFSRNARMSHPEQDMRLIGKRLVKAEEISSWDLDKLKQFTDGSKVVAREMRGKSTPFTPQAKLIFIGNVKPSLHSNDYGIERRLRLIPFEHRISETQRDRFFSTKLQAEAPYILNRMVKAAVQFCNQQQLQTPKYVLDASQEYFGEENIIGSMIETCCEAGVYMSMPFGEFYEAFSLWCIKAGFDCPGKKKTGQLLVNMGYKRGKGTELRLIKGLQIKKEQLDTPTPSEYNQMYSEPGGME